MDNSKNAECIGTLMRCHYTTDGAVLLSLDDYMHMIKSGRWRDAVTKLRNAVNSNAEEKTLTALKERMGFYVVAGDVRKKRVPECLRSPTGYAPFDIDHVPPDEARRIVRECADVPWIKAAHVSARGNGVHLFVKMYKNPREELFNDCNRPKVKEYQNRYREIADDIKSLFGVGVDQQCKDILRGFFGSYDPDALCKSDDEVTAFTPSKPSLFNSPPGEDKSAIKNGILSRFLSSNEYIRTKRHAWWVKFGQRLRFSGVTASEIEQYREAMTNMLEERHLLQSDGPVYRSSGEVDQAIRWGYEHSELRNKAPTDEDKSAKETKVQMIERFLATKRLRYDLISRKVQICTDPDGINLWAELADRELNSLWAECTKDTETNISMQTFRSVLMSNAIPAVNPLTEYVRNLPEWDESQPDYIAKVAAMVKTDSQHSDLSVNGELFPFCFRKWFVSMVASWLYEDVINHQVLVLIGKQGIYKTTWLDSLIPPQLAQYRSKQSSADRLDKDEQLRASEFGLVNMDEIDKMSERELNSLKSLITSSDINVRAAYGYGKERRVRIASYVASGNKERFLTDTTGNRRWLPFHVTSIESPYEHPLPYEGLYAQARWLLEHKFVYWFTQEDIELISPHVEEFMVETNEEELIMVYFRPVPPGTPGAVFLTLAEISAKLSVWGNIKRPMELRQLGPLMKRLGFVSTRRGKNGVRGYILQEYSAEHINAQRRLDAH